MIEISTITATMMNKTVPPLKVPKMPKWFKYTHRGQELEVHKDKLVKIAKDFNLKYTLDYLNATAVFVEKE